MSNSVIGNLRVNLAANTAAFREGMKSATSDLQRVKTVAGNVGKAVGVFALAAGAAAIKVSEEAREIKTMAELAGVSMEEFQKIERAAKTVGVGRDKIADILKDTNEKFGDFLQTGGGPLQDFFENIAPKVGVTADSFRDLNSADALQLYVDTLERAEGLSQADKTFYMEALASDATALLPLLKDNGAALREVGEGINQNSLLTDANAESGARFSAAWAELKGALTAVTKALVDAGLLDALASVMKVVAEFISAIPGYTSELVEWGRGVSEQVQAVAQSVSDGVQNITDFVSTTISNIAALPGWLAENAARMVNEMGAAVTAAANSFTKPFTDLAAEARALVSNLTDEVVAFFTELPARVVGFATDLVSGLADNLRNLDNLTQSLAALSKAVVTAIASIPGKIVKFGGQLVIDFGRSVEQAFPLLGQLLVNLGTFVRDEIAKIPSRIVRIGSEIVGGLIQGINERWGEFTARIAEMTDWMPSWVKDRLGIRSPSRVFMEIGRDVVAGFAVGIGENSARPVAALAEITSAFDGVGSVVSGSLKATLLNGARDFDGFADALSNTAERLRDRLLEQAFSPIEQGIDSLMSAAITGLGSLIGGQTGGGLFAGLGNLFAGFFADGGTIGAGQFGIVGERGPEIAVAGSTPMSITSLEGLRGGDSGVVVNQSITVTGLGIDDVERKLQPRFDQLRNETVRTVAEAHSRSPGYLGR